MFKVFEAVTSWRCVGYWTKKNDDGTEEQIPRFKKNGERVVLDDCPNGFANGTPVYLRAKTDMRLENPQLGEYHGTKIIRSMRNTFSVTFPPTIDRWGTRQAKMHNGKPVCIVPKRHDTDTTVHGNMTEAEFRRLLPKLAAFIIPLMDQVREEQLKQEAERKAAKKAA